MSEPAELLVFVNERPLRLAAGASARDAVAALDPALAAELAEGIAQLSDARGLPLASDTPLWGGAILRCARSARRPRDEADAHA